MKQSLMDKLQLSPVVLEEINRFLTDPENPLVERFFKVVDKFGGVDEINRKAKDSGKLENLMARLKSKDSPHVAELEWLMEARDRGSFITVSDYRKKVLGDRVEKYSFDDTFAVTLEISALNFFPWLMKEARQAVKKQELMPGRFIKVRCMKEQEEDGDLLATTAAIKIMGSSFCETLDTRGTDGSNVHLGGPETITGYFGGIGQPNDYPLKWLEEYLYYYTEYGIRQVLNINSGTILLAYFMNKIGIRNEFKISVYMGNDNPYAVLWTLMMANLLRSDDGRTSLIGFNFSNSVNNETIEICAEVRRAFGFEDLVRFEHHIFETFHGIVRQPYDRRDELMDLAAKVRNISAKHEGGEPKIEETREHPSNIIEYFLSKEDIEKNQLMPFLERSYLDKHNALNNTAKALTERGIAIIAAPNLHRKQ